MTTTTPVYAARELIAAGTTNAAGSYTRATLDLRGKIGGWLTVKVLNNGALGAQAVATVLIAHNDGATPAAAAKGANWKTFRVLGGNGLVSANESEWSTLIHGVQHMEIEIGGNTTNSVTCEAYFTEFSSAASA